MFVFGIHLAVLNYATPKDQTILVVLDDAENLLNTTENINIFKGMLDGADRCYKYSKKMDSTLASLSEQIVTAVQHHTSFVFTSNIKLPEYSELDTIKNPSRVSRVMHLLAIRDRVKNVDFDLSDEEMWGWITDAAHNGACVDYPDHIVQEATDFLWDNWSRLKTKSIRLVQQMCDEYTNDPVNYKTVWNLEYRR
jgi:hypothetical protein